jgi:Right handed beta helix region
MDRRSALTAALTLVAAESMRAQEPPQRSAAGLTPLERAAKISVVQESFAPGDVRRYGALGDGVSDDSGAWRAALTTGHRVLGGGAERVYCLDQLVPLVRATVIDLEGATIRPRGNSLGFVRTAPPPNANARVIRGAVQGSHALALDSTAGFAAGQWVRLTLNDYPAHDASSYPPSWARIAAVGAGTVDLATPLQVSYGSGEVHLLAYDPGVLFERFECRNGLFDGSQCTYDTATGQALRIGGTERVIVQGCEFRDFRHDGALTCAVELYQNIDVLLSDCRFTGGVSRSNICDIQDSRFAHFVNNQLDGSHFGLDITRIDCGLVANNSLQGRRAHEIASAAPERSARGVKAYGCAAIRILGNHSADYESPIKVDACFRYDVSHNTVFNSALGPYTGSIALNIGSMIQGRNMRAGRVVGNLVESCGGLGIGITSDAAGGICIADNIVRNTQGRGIHVAAANVIVSGNRVEDWGLRDKGDAAISVTAAASIVDNRFAHASLTTLPCLASNGATILTRDNVSESGNRLG